MARTSSTRGKRSSGTEVYEVYGYKYGLDGWSNREILLYKANAKSKNEALSYAKKTGVPSYGTEDARRAEQVSFTQNPAAQIGTKLTKVRIKVGKRTVNGMAKRVGGKVKVFVTPGVAKGLPKRYRRNPDYSISVPRYSFDPRKGDVFVIQGKQATVKSVRDDYVTFSRSIDGTTAMSVGNLYQVARVPATSRFAPYGVRPR